MIQGTTPTVTITMPQDISSWTVCSVAFAAVPTPGKPGQDTAVITKRSPDVTISGRTVAVTLSQEDTLVLGAGAANDRSVEVQVRGKNAAGQAFATGIMRLRLGRILEEGVV